MLNYENKEQLTIHGDILNASVKPEHVYRKILNIVNFTSLCKPLEACYSEDSGILGYPIETALKSIILQQLEDLSDREMEGYLQENLAAKLFCGFDLLEQTPDHSFFGRIRKRFDTEKIALVFNNMVTQLNNQNVFSKAFTFIDSTAITAKLSIWEERDKILSDKTPKILNKLQEKLPSLDLTGNIKESTSSEEIKTTNKNISNYAIDKDAKIGRKGKDNFWYGYKSHITVDGKSGIITAIEVTPANVLDHNINVLEKLLPEEGMILADRGYDTNAVEDKLKEKGLVSGIRKKKIRKNRNPDRDRWLGRLRSPFEGVFRYFDKVAPYRGLKKVKLHQILGCIALNLKRLAKIVGTPLFPVINVA